MARKLLAAVLGGLAFWVWSFVGHVVLPLGETGIQEIPNEPAVVASMKANIPADGLYFFPGYGLPASATHSEKMAKMKDLAPKLKAGPVGILVYHPVGQNALTLRPLLTELGTNMVQVLLAVLLLAQTSLTSFMARWRFVALAGVLAAISTNVSYWIFYGFPGNYTVAYVLNVTMGFACAGFVAAAMIKPGAGMPSTRAAGA